MSKHTKTLLAIATGMALLGSSISAATAAPTTNLTYAQFLETAGYKDFVAKSALGAEYLANQSGVVMTVDMTMTADSTTSPLANISVSATKTKSKTDMTVEGKTLTVYFIEGHAYSTMNSYKDLAAPDNISKVLARIPGSSSKMVKMVKMPEGLQTFDPADLFSSSSETYDTLLNSNFKDLLTMFQYSDVTVSANPSNETLTDYAWDMGFSMLGISSSVHSKYTLDANSLVVSGSVNSTMSSASGSMTTATTITMNVNNELVIDIPDLTDIVDEAQINRVSHQITAEGKSTAKANAIVKRAKELAKKARAALSGKHLRDAAKALKYTFTNISNGVRLTATVSKVKGSLCVVVGSGKATIKTC